MGSLNRTFTWHVILPLPPTRSVRRSAARDFFRFGPGLSLMPIMPNEERGEAARLSTRDVEGRAQTEHASSDGEQNAKN